MSKKTQNTKKVCVNCGEEFPAISHTCTNCGYSYHKPFYKKKWFIIFASIFIFCAIVGVITEDKDESPNNSISTPNNANIVSNTPITTVEHNPFSGDSGVEITAVLAENIIKHPEITATIKNTTSKKISAVEFHVDYFNVYGEKLNSIFDVAEWTVDTTINANSTITESMQCISTEIKTIKLYLTYVYFEDGSAWGDRDASESTILEKAPQINVKSSL